MTVKIAVTPEYADEKRRFHSNRLLLFLLLKKLTALSDIFFNVWKLCTCLVMSLLGSVICHESVMMDCAYLCFLCVFYQICKKIYSDRFGS